MRRMRNRLVWLLVLGVMILIVSADVILSPKRDASLLLALLFWSAVGQGIIALVAVSDLSRGRWLDPAKDFLLQYYPLLLIFPVSFLVFSRHLDIYPWLQEPNRWLDPGFFIWRNVTVLFLPFLAAFFYERRVRSGGSNSGKWAVLYLATFVVSQSFAAFDWAMSLEYPWIDTLMGGYFFVEALYGGIAFAAIAGSILFWRDKKKYSSIFNDTPVMLMGFALLWAGLFFSQYLVIWYGNIPEEVSFLEKRLSVPVLSYLGVYVLISLFVIPFILFISRRVKSSVPAVSMISAIIFSGLFVERFIILKPAAPVATIPAIILFILFSIPYTILLSRRLAKG